MRRFNGEFRLDTLNRMSIDSTAKAKTNGLTSSISGTKFVMKFRVDESSTISVGHKTSIIESAIFIYVYNSHIVSESRLTF